MVNTTVINTGTQTLWLLKHRTECFDQVARIPSPSMVLKIDHRSSLAPRKVVLFPNDIHLTLVIDEILPRVISSPGRWKYSYYPCTW